MPAPPDLRPMHILRVTDPISEIIGGVKVCPLPLTCAQYLPYRATHPALGARRAACGDAGRAGGAAKGAVGHARSTDTDRASRRDGAYILYI